MEKKEHKLEGYNLTLETNEEFDSRRIYRGKLMANCAAKSAVFRENRKRGPRNKVVYDGKYVAVSYSEVKSSYWFRFHNDSMQGFKPTTVTAELGLAVMAVKNHRDGRSKQKPSK